MALVEALVSLVTGVGGVWMGARITRSSQDRAANQKAAAAALALGLDLVRLKEELGDPGTAHVTVRWQAPMEVAGLHRWIEPLVIQLAERQPATAHSFALLDVLLKQRHLLVHYLLDRIRNEFGAQQSLEHVLEKPNGSTDRDHLDAKRQLEYTREGVAKARLAYEEKDAETRLFIDGLRMDLHRIAAANPGRLPTIG